VSIAMTEKQRDLNVSALSSSNDEPACRCDDLGGFGAAFLF
jgi:hypothetical protein